MGHFEQIRGELASSAYAKDNHEHIQSRSQHIQDHDITTTQHANNKHNRTPRTNPPPPPTPTTPAHQSNLQNLPQLNQHLPLLRKEMATFIRLGEIDETQLYKSDAGGENLYPIRALQPLAFFYPEDGERRLFVRFQVEPEFTGRLLKADASIGALKVVDRVLGDVRVGWHCGCFKERKGEGRLKMEGLLSFRDVFGVVRAKHEGAGFGGCASMVKFWIDGLWDRSREIRELGC
ncbi:hypothetical protein Q7P37_009616 [Cladosporium fusiforme]